MDKIKRKMARIAFTGAFALTAAAMAEAAQAQDFFSNLFGGFGFHRSRQMAPMPYVNEEGGVVVPEAPRRRAYSSGSQAYCVRTCDGRYFPISNSGNQSRAASCNSFCPASETKVVYGGNIDDAVTEDGKNYSELPNAYRYRDELVSGCTCNGKDPVGLAKVKIEDDPTLRRGDVVASPDGLMVAVRGADRRGVSLELSPAPESVRSRYRRVPVVARQ
jgi:Protein of unknown function (DUF2865)